MSIESITADDIVKLSENDVWELLSSLNELPKEKKAHYSNLFAPFFEIRTVSKKNRSLILDLTFMGFKFFSNADDVYVKGIKKKNNRY